MQAVDQIAGSERRARAAELLAAGKHTLHDICAEIDVDQATLWRWRRSPDFRRQVRAIEQEIQAGVVADGVAVKAERIRVATERVEALQRLIDERAEHGRRYLPHVAGADTGLLTRVAGPDGEYYAFDAGVTREIRETLRYLARELGEWREQPRPAVSDTISFTIAMGDKTPDTEQSGA
jgi:transposase-like protein